MLGSVASQDPPAPPTPVSYKTVGPAGSGANYICDGYNDEAEINTALATKLPVHLKPGIYNIGNPININASDTIYKLMADDLTNWPQLKSTSGQPIISSTNGKFEISNVVFNANNYVSNCIRVLASADGSSIHHCVFMGYTSTSTSNWGCGISGDSGCAIDIYSNNFIGSSGVHIYMVGKDPYPVPGPTNGVPTASTVFYAKIHGNIVRNTGAMTTIANSPAFSLKYCHAWQNTIISHGNKGSTVATSSGSGINACRCWIEYNQVYGCGQSGIIPTSFGGLRDDCYSWIDHNICRFNGSCGIDYWYSDGCKVTNNICNDNGQCNDVNAYADRVGIDIQNYSKNTVVSNNECTCVASTITDSILTHPAGQKYITVQAINRWQEGMLVRIVYKTVTEWNRIDRIDASTGYIYLLAVPGSAAVKGATMSGVNLQMVGIHTGGSTTYPANSGGNHTGVQNHVWNNVYSNIGRANVDDSDLTKSILPLNGAGTGPSTFVWPAV